MHLLRSIAMAFSMFSVVPMPALAWDKDNLRDMLAAFPLVGALIGGAVMLWFALCRALAFGPVLTAAGATLIPLLLSGGIHLDGLCDVFDALASHASPEKRREILKDPHVGAFGVIGLCAYLLAYFALCTELSQAPATALFLALIHVLSRALGGLATALFPASGEGLFKTFQCAADKNAAILLGCWLLLTALMMLLVNVFWGLAALIGALICLAGVYLTAKNKFGGMSGDLAGLCVQLSELVMVGLVMLLQKAVAA